MIKLQQSNILEVLAEGLAQRLSESGLDPLVAEVVVVPNPGMGRWLSHYLTSRDGVAANMEYLNTGEFFWRVLRAWLPKLQVSPFDAETLLWRIQAVLNDSSLDLLADPAFAQLQHYIEGDDPDLRLFQLSQRIADVFDQYLVYRPEMVLAWEEREEEGDQGGEHGRNIEGRDAGDAQWQAKLWRELTRADGNHRARLLRQLSMAMQRPPSAPEHLPARVSFFGLNALAPVYMDILKMLGQYLDISISHMNLSEDYWADIQSEKSTAKRQAKSGVGGKRAIAFAQCDDPFVPFLDLGNPLLASMGHIGQAFLDQLLELDADADDHFSAPVTASILHNVQTDILQLEDGRELSRKLPAEAWPSLQVHGTHTPLREVQVLHNNLLRCFEQLDDLKPRDILVLAPNMAAYVPLVEAVFNNEDSSTRGQTIPFSIADRPPGGDKAMGEAISFLLKLPDSRLSASDVLSFLEVEAVQSRFGLGLEDLEKIRLWVRESGIRWAADGQHREDLGLPADAGLHSWQFGLRRLFLGYVTPVNDTQRMYGGNVPYLDIEGGDLLIAGALQSLLDGLNHWRKSLSKPRLLAQWQSDFAAMFAQFFQAEDEEANLLQLLAQRLGAVREKATEANFEQLLPLSVIHAILDESLNDTSRSHGFLQGGVTFSNMIPMRSLPFRVIYMLGMNETDFPRRQSPNSFDLMAQKPRRGDRSRRLDDRYIFLEALCSARDCLFMSYQSRNPRSDKPSLPAETISELMDYLDGCYPQLSAQSVEQTVIPLSQSLFTQHPLQAFSPRYFNPSPAGENVNLFSYDSAWAFNPGEKATQAFFTADDSVVIPADPVEINVDELIRFFKNPARVYLQQQLDMRLPGAEDIIEDEEPFELNGLENWQLKDQLLAIQLQGIPADASYERLRGEGRLPHGVPGTVVLDNASEEATLLGQQLQPYLAARPAVKPLVVNLQIGAWQLVGEIQPFNRSGVIDYKAGTVQGYNQLVVWIKHLIVSAQIPEAAESILVGISKRKCEVVRFNPVSPEQAMQYLQTLLEYSAQGLSQPLPFFPKTSWAWCSNDGKWQDKWHGSKYSSYPGEAEDPAFALVFGEVDPFTTGFESLASAIYQPVIDNTEVV